MPFLQTFSCWKISSVARFLECARRSRRALEPHVSGWKSLVCRLFEERAMWSKARSATLVPFHRFGIAMSAWLGLEFEGLFLRYVLVGQTTLGNDLEANVQQYNSASSQILGCSLGVRCLRIMGSLDETRLHHPRHHHPLQGMGSSSLQFIFSFCGYVSGHVSRLLGLTSDSDRASNSRGWRFVTILTCHRSTVSCQPPVLRVCSSHKRSNLSSGCTVSVSKVSAAGTVSWFFWFPGCWAQGCSWY